MGKEERSPLLEALCILSFIGNGIAFLVYMVAAVFNQPAQEWIGKLSSLYDTSRFNSFYFTLFSLLYLVSFTGVLKMWNLKKAGFYIYTGAQIAILLLPGIWLGSHAFSATVTIFTALFISLFAIQIRKL